MMQRLPEKGLEHADCQHHLLMLQYLLEKAKINDLNKANEANDTRTHWLVIA